MNALKEFNHSEFGAIRTVDRNGEPWFLARDAARALGYAGTAKAIRVHCKGVSEMDTPSAGGIQKAKIIPESDLYRLILRSKLPSAEAFQDWVTMDVLPAIRRTGQYAVAPREPSPSLTDLTERVARLEADLARTVRRVEERPRLITARVRTLRNPAMGVARWIIEQCHRTEDCRSGLYSLAQVFNEWAALAGEPTVSTKRFGMILTELDVPKIRRPQGMFVALDVNEDFS